MIRVLFLIPDLGHGGAERVLVNLVNHLDRERFDVTVMTLFDEGVNKQHLRKDVQYRSFFRRHFPANSRILARIPAKNLYRWVVRERYDVIVSYLEGPTAHVLDGCDDQTTKKIAWVHTELDPKLIATGFCSKQAAISAYLAMDRLVFVSQKTKETFERAVGKDLCAAQVLYNTIETDMVAQKAQIPIEDLTFSKDTINVISVSKVIEVKGFDRLACAHKRLIEEGIRHNIYIVGVGDKQREIESYLAKHYLTESFTFIGFRDNPYPYVKAADVYICSSRREGFSTAITESLIVGTPVVTTCCSGAYELLGEKDPALTQEENGKYELCTCGIVTENSEQGIYEGLKRMLQDASLRELYAKRAYERGQYFSTEQTVSAVEKMLVELYEEN